MNNISNKLLNKKIINKTKINIKELNINKSNDDKIIIKTDKNHDLWINKYKPTSINQIIGNSNQIKNFKDWICNLSTNKNQGIIISGNQGLGKTLTIKLILEELGYIPRIINPNEIKDHRIYDDFNDYYNFTNSIYTKINFSEVKNKKIALVFDETENITLTSEKKYIMDIYKDNNKSKSFPLIFISNNQHSKLLNDLKKGCAEIVFITPTIPELKQLVKKISLMEHITWDSDQLIEKVIMFGQNDVRRLINLLQEISFHLVQGKVTESSINEFIDKSREKNVDIGLFDSTERILNNYLDYETIIKLYESEKVLLPLMIHENYLKKILNKSKDSWSDIISNIVKVSDSISRGDNIETSIYTDQNWYLQNIHGFYTCINTSFWINKSKSIYKIDSEDIKFSSDLNKTSLKNINRKNIINLSKIINNKSNQEILMLNRICNHLIQENKEDELIRILNGYNKDISIKEVELCLKIDKTTEFNTLASKDKKRITKQIYS
jgi:replication factor C subunit 1